MVIFPQLKPYHSKRLYFKHAEMTAAILSALNLLTKPLGERSIRDSQPSQKGALLAALQANRGLLLERLQNDPGFEEVRRLREEAQVGSSWFCSGDTPDAPWQFVQECLLLLLALARHLSAQLELFAQAAPPTPAARLRTPEFAPPLPPDVLSVSQQKTLAASLQFVVSLGLCPYLEPGVGVALGRRSAFGAVVAESVAVLGPREKAGERRLMTTAGVLLRLAELSSLATLIFTRHLGDVMAALCQLGHRPLSSRGGWTGHEELGVEERLSCREALKSILGKVYQPIVVKELLILQGGPKQTSAATPVTPAWLRRLCGVLLTDRLVQPHGVQAVVRAILEGGTGSGGESDWRKCDGVAKILVACPKSVSPDDYYRQVCPQILDLLHFKDKLTALQFQRVATRATLAIVEHRPEFGQRHILSPLVAPVQRCATGDPQCTVEEWELTQCVDDVYKICVVGNSPSTPLLNTLGELIPVLFSLFCFTKKNVCHLRAPCQEILLWFLGQAGQARALAALGQLSGLRAGPDGAASPDLHFSPGSNGGAKLGLREPISNEDDALYERLSGEQWRLQCFVDLLAEIRDSDLTGDFFLGLLKELTSWTTEEDEEEEVNLSAMTLLEVEQHLSARALAHSQRLSLLQVLAVLCEGLPHDLLLRKMSQVVDFMVSLLQRACVGLDRDRGSDSGRENPIEAQTLSMGMGLVATLLSGPSLTAEDYSCMARLLPALQQISQKHPEVVIQELASGLRAVIATHGACRPDDLRTSVQQRFTERASAHDSSRASARSDTRPPPLPVNPLATAQHLAVANPVTTQSSPTHLAQTRPLSSGSNDSAEPTRASDPGRRQSSVGPADLVFSDLLLEACDPEVPTRAVALRMLTRMVQDKIPEALQAQDKVLLLFLENLEHEDSFVYLSAIQGLAVLADAFPERILQRLLGEFQQGQSLPAPNKERSLEMRLKVGEVLMRASRAMGDLAPHHGRPLMGAFLQGTRDRDATVRASSLSNLGELSQRLDYALGPLAQELSSCLTALIKTEKEAEVRRAAVHVLVLLLRGLSHKTTQVLSDVLMDLYRALKWVVRSDRDDVTVVHAQLALEELDDVMRTFIFPEQKLEKKIVVLP